MIKYFIFPLFLVLGGCSHTPDPIPIGVPEETVIFHPVLPTPPQDPKIQIKVITVDTIESGKAYIGFEYANWLEFAQWAHEYRAYSKNLKDIIETYKSQLKEKGVEE